MSRRALPTSASSFVAPAPKTLRSILGGCIDCAPPPVPPLPAEPPAPPVPPPVPPERSNLQALSSAITTHACLIEGRATHRCSASAAAILAQCRGEAQGAARRAAQCGGAQILVRKRA